MWNAVEDYVFRRDAPRQVRHISPLDYGAAEGLAKRAIEQMQREFQAVPPITVHLASPELMAAVWSIARETMVAGTLARGPREVVAAAVSALNACPFCVDVHTSMLHGTGDHALASQLAHGDIDESPLASWAGATRSPGDSRLASPPFPSEQAAQLKGVAASFHYVNRVVNVFLYDSPLPVPGALRGMGRRMFGGTLARRILARTATPGVFLTDEPSAGLPGAFAWAAADGAVAGAFARWAGALEAIGSHTIPAGVRDAVSATVTDWEGEDMPLGTAWVDDALAGVTDPGDRIVGRVALMAALASYRVSDEDAAALRDRLGDRALVETVAWGAYQATQRIAGWM